MLVMTIIGRDRPGLVDSVAALVAEHGGNWLESRMSRLGGQFAGILRVEVPPAQEPALAAALKQLEDQGLTTVVQADPLTHPAPAARGCQLEVVGLDRPGIIRQISRVLAGCNVNVEELHSECASGAMSGEPVFHARVRLSLPESCDTNALREELEKIAADLIVEVSLVELREPSPGD